MKTIRETIQRDLGEKIEGVVKVFDLSSLAPEIREYVVTDKIEEELKKGANMASSHKEKDFEEEVELGPSGMTPPDAAKEM